MNHSTTLADKIKIRWWAVALWLLVWQLGAMIIGKEILLASPALVAMRLFELAETSAFWDAVWFSLVRIVAGFLLSLALGGLLAAISGWSRRLRELLEPLVAVMKSTPVASFIILCLIWIPSQNLSVFVSFLIGFPVVYTNLCEGIAQVDGKLLEMADLFRVPMMRRIRYIYLSGVLPYLRSACKLTMGMCWKAGIAAEVIGNPIGSIGEQLYLSKLYLETADLLAWTVVIILASVLIERLLLAVLARTIIRLERM